MVYDVFISYRREGGYETAKHINDLLVRDGYSVSFDIDTLREGNFDKALLKRVEECVDFLLIVDKQCFEKTISGSCKPDQDWLRQEVAYALKLKKNIVTVLLAGASFPPNLPDDISEVAMKNGPIYSKGYFDTFYERLKNEFLHALPRNKVMKKTADDDTRSVACLKLRTDMECLFYLDGEEKMRLKPGKIQKIPLQEGEYELKFVSVDNEADVITIDFVMPAVDKLYNVNLFDVWLSRIELEGAQERFERERAEAERKAKEEAERERLEREQQTKQANGHEYVDLGLPSGTLWATCNVGANKPEDYGILFSWDEGKTAAAKWGNGWAMPTKEQWEELKENTKSSWTTRNGVNGRLFTANNGNSLFLPAAGYHWVDYYGDYGVDDYYNVDSWGIYWSSSLYKDDPSNVWSFYFLSGRYYVIYDDCRIYDGQSVRPVRSARQN